MKKQIEMHTFSFVPQLVTQNSLSITSQGWCIVLRYGNCGGMHPGEGERAQQVRSPGKQQILGESFLSKHVETLLLMGQLMVFIIGGNNASF